MGALTAAGRAISNSLPSPRTLRTSAVPAVRVRDGADERETEPGPPGPLVAASGAEPVEDVRQLAGGDAAAGVADAQPDRAVPAAVDRQL